MTKEELEKEAEDYANKKVPKAEMPIRNSELVKAYLAGAEPREKRIAELEQKLEQIRNYLAKDIPHELKNEATNKIWKLL